MDFTSDTAFWSLDTIGYILMGLAALFTFPIFSKSQIEIMIRWCFVANDVFTVLGGIGYILSGNPLHVLVITSLGVWAITFPIAAALLAVIFKRAQKIDG